MGEPGGFAVEWPQEGSSGGRRMTFSRAEVSQFVAAAVASGRTPPWRAPYWRDRLMAGGRAGAEAITTLIQLTPAPPDIAAAWDRDPRTVAAGSPAAGPTPDQVYDALYPAGEAAAADAGRRSQAAAGTGAPHHEVIDHGPVTVPAHEHEHASYDGHGGTHRHAHAHSGDADHQPGTNHMHQLAAADGDAYARLWPDAGQAAAHADAEAGRQARQRPRPRTYDNTLSAGGPADADLYDKLFGPE
jgi:hypothetical protein